MHYLRLLQPAILSTTLLLLTDASTARPSRQAIPPDIKPVTNNGKVASHTLIPRNPPPASATSFPLPAAIHWPLQSALDGGWSVAVHVFSYFYPLSPNTSLLEDFFTGIQAYALAQMLQGFSDTCRVNFAEGDFVLLLGMHPRSTVGTVKWSMVYAFARYMLKWVHRGFSGSGGLLFYHQSGIMLAAAVSNHDSVGLPEDTVHPDECSS